MIYLINVRRVASIGGAAAWGVYARMTHLFPDINHDFRFTHPANEPGDFE